MADPGGSGRVLICDDQNAVRHALRLLLKREGLAAELAASPAAALDAVRAHDFDVALIDLNYTRDTTAGREGLDLLSRLLAVAPALPVVVMTAWASVALAVDAMRRGARDFVEKPWENARLLSIIRTQIELGRAIRKGVNLEAELALARDSATPEVVAESDTMARLVELARTVAVSDASILILGENGTGKGVLARTIHQWSDRRDRPLITVDLGGVSESLFETELFGHVKGAFTNATSNRDGRFERADGGTLFLDEIANVPAAQQTKLLRIVESGEFEPVGSSRTRTVDVRLICATNAALDVEVMEGRFRQDLYFRLNTVELTIPPLRHRRDDIPILAHRFLQASARRYRKPVDAFSLTAMRRLLEHPWPGNVRELAHVVERAVLVSAGETVQETDLLLRRLSEPDAAVALLEGLSLEEMEAALVRKAMADHATVKDAANALGLSRGALYRRLERHGISPGLGKDTE